MVNSKKHFEEECINRFEKLENDLETMDQMLRKSLIRQGGCQ